MAYLRISTTIVFQRQEITCFAQAAARLRRSVGQLLA